MSGGDLAIRVEGLGKKFNLNLMPHLSIKEQAELRMSRVRKRASEVRRDLAAGRWPRRGSDSSSREFWALRDVSFDLHYGEVLGIIGLNGSGKSTLLKILAQVMAPTEGRAELHGRIGALLEVGTGFNPELTGRENIYLYGSVLGMDKAAISRRFDEIVAFADITKFLEEPIKHYSSGMYSRLGFSVAAHLECDILLVDEVLSVGDATFTAKCMDKMREVTGQGRAVVFVSHGLGAVDSMCDNGMVLESGRIAFTGLAEDAIEHYMAGVRERLQQKHKNPVEFEQDESVPIQFKSIRMCGSGGNGGAGGSERAGGAGSESAKLQNVFRRDEEVTLFFDIVARQPCPQHIVSLTLSDERNNKLIYSTDEDTGLTRPHLSKAGEYTYKITLPKNLLKTGRYFVSPAITGGVNDHHEEHINLLCFMVEETPDSPVALIAASHRPNLIAPDINWQQG